MLVRRLRASVVCQAEGRLLVVCLRDPVSHVDAYFPPGGAVEVGEEPFAAAERETVEETGLTVVVDRGSVVVLRYPFRWASTDYDVETHFFAASLVGSAELRPVVDAPYHRGAMWLPTRDALDAMAIHPVIAGAIARILEHRSAT